MPMFLVCWTPNVLARKTVSSGFLMPTLTRRLHATNFSECSWRSATHVSMVRMTNCYPRSELEKLDQYFALFRRLIDILYVNYSNLQLEKLELRQHRLRCYSLQLRSAYQLTVSFLTNCLALSPHSVRE